MVALKGPKIIVQPISSCKHHFMVCGTDRCQSSIWQFGLPGTGPIIIKWFECFCALPVITIVWFCSRNKTSLSSLTGWNASQITEHLHNCIQLSRDNVSVAWFEILTCVNWTCQRWNYLFMYWKFQRMLTTLGQNQIGFSIRSEEYFKFGWYWKIMRKQFWT